MVAIEGGAKKRSWILEKQRLAADFFDSAVALKA
jgi:hypothetical protein